MINPLKEIKTIIGTGRENAQVGTITGKRRDGGYYVTGKGDVQFTVSGTADIGDAVLFADGQILTRIEKETIRTYYIK